MIRKLSNPSDWKYIGTKENIADMASRPCTPSELKNSRWVSGPSFLHDPAFLEERYEKVEDLPEEDKVDTEVETDGKWNRLLRVRYSLVTR